MTEAHSEHLLHVPARDIPGPRHLSPEARAQLATGTIGNPAWPAPDDLPAWRALIARMDAMGEAGLGMLSQPIAATVQTIDANGVRVYEVTPAGVAPAVDVRIVMYSLARRTQSPIALALKDAFRQEVRSLGATGIGAIAADR